MPSPSLQDQICTSCRSPRATLECGVCTEPVCKKCVQYTSVETFKYLPEIPESLLQSRYCVACFDTEVQPTLSDYEATVERAKEIRFLPISYQVQLKVIKKAKHETKIKDCADRDEVIMKLAYLAAKEGYNSLIQAEVLSAKVRNHGYQSNTWSGTALSATIDTTRLDRDELREEIYRVGR